MFRSLTLKQASMLFVASWLVHTADHARRGLTATTEAVVWGGTLVGLLAAVSITLIAARHAVAPLAAAIVFPSVAIGVAATHLLPKWGVLSDPILVDSATDAWSIVAVVPEIVAAAVLGAVALRVLSRHGYSRSIEPASWAEAPRLERTPATD